MIATDVVGAFVHTLPFTLDPFQHEAIAALAQGESVLVAAPTGSGKTVVADFAAFHAMRGGFKLVYTTPIKALSNQKYRQLAERYGSAAVGIVTGDTVVNRQAALLVMTTEVLRNLLVVSKDPLREIGYVVIDEVHFLADRERGVIWEETLIWCPPHVRLVCLSATVGNPEEVASWLNAIHGPTTLVRHDERPVPLVDYLYHEGDLQTIRDAGGRRVQTFPRLGLPVGRPGQHLRRGRPRNDRRGGEDADLPLAPALVRRLQTRHLLPAIYFRFGRRVVEEVAWSVANAAVLSPPDATRLEAIEAAMARAMGAIDDDTRGLAQVQDLLRLLPHGLAYHHAGLIHPLKVLVEELFASGYLEVVVATSTLSMGLHLPARAVVIGEMKKYNGRAVEALTASEYRQMTGRAGRRGIDTRGAAVLVPSATLPFEVAYRRMSGPPESLRSAFELRYNTLLNTYRPDDEEHLLTLIENNLAAYQRRPSAVSRSRPMQGSGRSLRTRLHAMLEILRSEDLLDEHHDLTLRGQAARHLFNQWELSVIDLLLSGVLDSLDPAQTAEAMSLFIPSKFVTTGDDRPRRYGRPHGDASRHKETPLDLVAWEIGASVRRIMLYEAQRRLVLTPEWVRPDHRFVSTWCAHGLLSTTVAVEALPAGDALQVLGQTLDLLDQCRRALVSVFGAENEHAVVMRAAVSALSHGGKLERLLGL